MKDIHGVEHKIGSIMDKRTPVQKSMLRHGLKEMDRKYSSKSKALSNKK